MLFFLRTSNFGAEAERSYMLPFEVENVLKLHGIHYFSKINADNTSDFGPVYMEKGCPG